MKREHPFETKMRMSKFPSQDAAHEAIRGDSLVPGYLFEQLRDRGLIEHALDGSVVGIPRKERKEATASKTWGDTWPAREAVIRVLGMEEEGMSFGDLKDNLDTLEEKSGYWAVQHALRVLIAEKVVVKVERKYVLAGKSPAKDAATKPAVPAADVHKTTWEAVSADARRILLAAINKVGPDAAKLTEFLGHVKMMNHWGEGKYATTFSQPFIDWVVKANKEIES